MNEGQELYAWYKKNEICPQCGRNKAAPHRVRCEECLAKNAEASRIYRENHYSKSRKEYDRKRREENKKKGLCIWCGRPLSKYSTCYCPDCRIKNKRRQERKKDGISRSERTNYGMCYCCGKPIAFGEKLCENCKKNHNNLNEKSRNEWYQYNKRENNALFGN